MDLKTAYPGSIPDGNTSHFFLHVVRPCANHEGGGALAGLVTVTTGEGVTTAGVERPVCSCAEIKRIHQLPLCAIASKIKNRIAMDGTLPRNNNQTPVTTLPSV
jgi:hypothetical protein